MRTFSNADAMLARLAADPDGAFPVGTYTDRRGYVRRESYSTAAALVRRGYAVFRLGSDGDRWIEITAKGRRNTGGAW